MRITSGRLKGRVFKAPKVGMRPTKGLVREAIFSSLATRVLDARVLDLFAGAGGVAFEAWSCGASSVTAVENVFSHWKILQKNFQTLNDEALGGFQIVRSDVFDFLEHNTKQFDLVFADPPYQNADLPRLLKALNDALAVHGVLVFEMHSSNAYSLCPSWNLCKEKVYGKTRTLFLEQTK